MSESIRSASSFERYQPYRRGFEIGFWVASTLVSAIGNSVTVSMDIGRAGLDFAPWEPPTWEWSSSLVFLMLVPAVVWFTRRFPLHMDTWRRLWSHYLLASVAFSVSHVLAMVALRKLVYAAMGTNYDYGYWPREMAYEYLKDVRSFATCALLVEGYRFVIRRLQGEASLLEAPDEGLPVEPLDRPERFLVRKLGREFLVAAADIESLQASGNYVNLRVRGRDYPLRSTIAAIEARLDPNRFLRVHRSHIVNIDHLVMIEPLDTGDARLHLKDGSTLPCSRRYRAAVRERAGTGGQEMAGG